MCHTDPANWGTTLGPPGQNRLQRFGVAERVSSVSMVRDRSMARDRLDETIQALVVQPPTVEDIYKSEWAALVRLALVMTGDRSRAEDIVHDTFVRLATRSLPRDPPSYLRR